MRTRQGGWGRVQRLIVLALVGFGAVLIAAACGSSSSSSTPTAAASVTTTSGASAATSAADVLKPGAAGIASHPRDIAGILTIDDGVAMFKTRPASEDRTGVSKDSIKIGRYVALTGPGAVVGPATAAMHGIIDAVNAAGGVHGRKIELLDRDDQFNPSITVQVTQELVERDGVFAMFAGLGSAPTSAVFDYLNLKGVPNLFAYSGATKFVEPVRPLFSGSPPYLEETLSIGQLIFKEHPNAKLAIVYQNDDYGKANILGLETAAKADNGSVVAQIGYDIGTPDLSSQVQQVVNSGASAVYLAAYANEAVKIIKGLREGAGSSIPIYCSGVCTSQTVADGAGHANYNGVTGQISTLDSQIDAQNPVVTAVKALADSQKQAFTTTYIGGIMYTEDLIHALELAGPDLTREGLVLALDHGFDGSWTCSVCLAPSIMGPQDHNANESWQPVTYNGTTGVFEKDGPVIVRETSKGEGIRGNVAGFDCTEATPCPWKTPPF